MAKKLGDMLAELPVKRRAKIEQRAQEVATLKEHVGCGDKGTASFAIDGAYPEFCV